MQVSEDDIFFRYSDDFKLIEDHTEVIRCGKSDIDLIKSVLKIQKFVALGSAIVSKSHLHESRAKQMLYRGWFQTYYFFNETKRVEES